MPKGRVGGKRISKARPKLKQLKAKLEKKDQKEFLKQIKKYEAKVISAVKVQTKKAIKKHERG